MRRSTWLFVRVFTRGPLRALPGLGLLLALLTGLAVPASADGISGRVYGPDGKPQPNTAFTARREKSPPVEFLTDASGDFSVYLDQGRYTVSSQADPSLEGVIVSQSQPVQQDIHLKKAKR